MFDKLKAFWHHIRSFEMKEDCRDNYPYSIEIGNNGFQYYVDAYIILLDSEMREYGIRWASAKYGVYEFHGHPFMVRFNSNFQMHQRPPDIPVNYGLPYHW